MMTNLRRGVAIAAIIAPALHLVSDALEWIRGGFSPAQLGITYLAFLIMPFLALGLFAVQRPRIGVAGLAGAVLYAVAFIYFAHTSLYALEERIADYEVLWARLGAVYTVHGGLMILGGALFGLASLEARVLSRPAIGLFLLGVGLNLLFALLPLPAIAQTGASTIRNLGLIGVGVNLLRAVPRASGAR